MSWTAAIPTDRKPTGRKPSEKNRGDQGRAERARHRRPGDPSAPWTGAITVRGRRHAWVDAGRGLAILLVAFVHAEEWFLRAGFDVRPWHAVNGVLVGMRMPLFFTVSGMLGAGWLARSWSHTFSRKVGFLLWVYLVWQPIGLLASLMADQFTGHRQTVFHFFAALAATTVRPRSELWFLWALAAYFALAWVCRRVPALLQLAVAAGVAAVCLSGVVRVPEGWNLVPNFHVFFLLGLHHRDVLLWTADRVVSARRTGAVIVGAWIAVATASALFGLEQYVGVGLGIRVLGLGSGVVLAVWLTDSRLLRYLGSRTLPIYLAHTPILLGLVWAVYGSRDRPVVASAGPLLPLVATVVSVAGSLALYAVLRHTSARYLYEPPDRVTAALERLASGSRGSGDDVAGHADALAPVPHTGASVRRLRALTRRGTSSSRSGTSSRRHRRRSPSS